MSQNKIAELCLAIKENNLPLIEDLLKNRIDLNIINSDGRAPIHHAAFTGNLEVIELLLQYKADIDIQNHYGNTALMISIGAKQMDAMCLLLASGANVEIKNKTGQSPKTHILNLDEIMHAIRSANN